MSILKDLLSGKGSKKIKPEDTDSLEEKVQKGWYSSVQNFNDKVAHLLTVNSKVLIFATVAFFAYLLFASIFQKETFSIKQLNVHSSLDSNGYNSEFIAKKISYNIAMLVNQVPKKLFDMFAKDKAIEKNEILYNMIMDKYLKKEIKIDMDVNVGGVNLPLQDITKTARRLLNMQDKYLSGDITMEGDLIVMTLGFNSNGVIKNFTTEKYRYSPSDSIMMIDVIDSMTLDAAIFVLKQYDPFVTLLMDYNPEIIYSSSVDQWHETIYNEADRIRILKELYLNEKTDKELAIWSHAVTGALYSEKFERIEDDYDLTNAIEHFEKSIEMDASFIDIVGSDLARIYSNLKDTTKVLKIYRQMIESDPENLEVHKKLLHIYSDLDNSKGYYKTLEDAFKHGLHIPEAHLRRPQFRKYRDEHRFKALVEKYNEENKPKF